MFQTKNGKPISKIGIGTWTINKENLEKEIQALDFYFENGVNYIDVVLSYDNGLVLDVISQFLKNKNREDFFINALITMGCNNPSDIDKQINHYLTKLNTSYLDCVTLHSPIVLGFDLDTYVKTINDLRKTNKFLHVGLSNLSPEDFEKYCLNKDNGIVYYQGLYNLECKISEDTKIIPACKDNGIEFFAYQPLRRNRTAKQQYPEVVSLAQKYNKTQNQIIINWLVKHKQLNLLIKSSNKAHIKENLDSLNFDMDVLDYKTLDNFRNKEFDNIPVTYLAKEDGKVRIDQLPNQQIGVL